MEMHISLLLELEKRLRRADSPAQLYYTIVNQTHYCLPYTQSVLLTDCPLHHVQVTAASDIPVIDYTSPFIQWIESLSKAVIPEQTDVKVREIRKNAVTEKLSESWCEMSPDYLLWIPLRDVSERNRTPAHLLLFRDTPWTESEKIVAEHLSDSMGHALLALHRPGFLTSLLARVKMRKVVGLTALVLFALLWLPVRLTTLAPVEVIAKEPFVVSAPINGVIRAVVVEPNAVVEPGRLLVEFEDAELKSKFEVAEQTLNVALAELKTIEQSGFMDPALKSQMAELEARVKLRTAERNFAAEKLAKTSLRAKGHGVAVLEDPNIWKGRPVDVGERILLLASPDQLELEILLPVKDSIALKDAAEVRLFFDYEPLNVWKGTVRHASYSPTLTPEDQMAYRLIAELNPEESSKSLPRIGMQGTAKLYGEQVSLFFLLFRRPITAVRQWLGW